MKPRLLKFSCHSCGARLAVPPEMAGRSDHCPKCGTLVTAPSEASPEAAPPPEAVAATAPAAAAAAVTAPPAEVPDLLSSAQLVDALRPERAAKPRDIVTATATPAAAAPAPATTTPAATVGAAPPPPTPVSELIAASPAKASTRRPAHEVLDSILRESTPVLKKPDPAPRPSAPEPEPAPPPPSALTPHAVTDSHEVEKAAMPGMGEVLAEARHTWSDPVVDSTYKQPLNVPLMQVGLSGRQERRAWGTHFKVTAIICFVLVDLLLLFLYKDRIAVWWRGEPRAETAGQQSLNTKPAAQPPEPTPLAAAKPGPEPAAQPPGPMPDGILQTQGGSLLTGPPPGLPNISAPSDFATSPQTTPAPEPAKDQVPMAIPLPGHTAENVPTAVPVTAPAATEAPPMPPPVPVSKPEPAPPATAPQASPEPVAAAPAPSAPLMPMSTLLSLPTESAVPAAPPMPPPLPAEPPAVPQTTAPGTVTAPPVTRRIGKTPAEAKPALEGLTKFLDASTWQERLACVQKPETVKADLEKHAAATGDGPIVVGNISFVERYPSKGDVPPYCMFELSEGSLKHPVLTLVELGKDGPRVDWEAFIEFKEDRLLRFLETKSAPPQKFRVLLRRKHYFDRDVPDIAGKDSFMLQQPNANFEGHVFVQRASTLGRQLANQLGWSQDMPVIAELAWKSDGKAYWVEIQSIVSYGWRG